MGMGTLKQNNVHLENHEYETVKLLLNQGFDIELIPPSQIAGLQMADLIMQGIPWEMKAPQGNGRNTIRHTLQNAGHQATSVIVDLRRCKLSEGFALKELEYYFNLSKRIRRLKVITAREIIIDYAK